MMETPAEHTLPYNKDAIGIAYDRKSERIEGIQIPFRTLPDAIKLATRYWVETHPQDPELYSQIYAQLDLSQPFDSTSTQVTQNMRTQVTENLSSDNIEFPFVLHIAGNHVNLNKQSLEWLQGNGFIKEDSVK